MDLKGWLRKNPDRAGAWVAIVLGGVVLLLGWQGASTTAYPAEQLPYILSGGIGGALLVALGATLLISADLRDEWRKLDRIERRLGHDAPSPQPDAAPATPDAAPATPDAAPATPDAALAEPEASGQPEADVARTNGRRRRLVAEDRGPA